MRIDQRIWQAVQAADERSAQTGTPRMPAIGAPPESRRQLWIKICWVLVYMVYIGGTVADLTGGHHGPVATALGTAGLVAFIATYIVQVVVHRPVDRTSPRSVVLLGVLYLLAIVLSATLGPAWLVLFVYVGISSGVFFAPVLSSGVVTAVVATTVGIGLATGASSGELFFVALPAFLGGGAMIALQTMVRTMGELREARETVAHLAASDERLRLARDLHDLLGHSLSLITLKSELTGRMLPAHPEDAAQQVADIERVSRQALVDVREAVTGFRRPNLAVELAGVRTTLRTARIEAQLDPALDQQRRPDLDSEQEGALAWALREAVTNVVRHSRATRCEITMDEVWDEEGRFACLEVLDNGTGPSRSKPGNGLSGLRERLILSGGRLETGPGPRNKGFRMRALVPVSSALPAVEEVSG